MGQKSSKPGEEGLNTGRLLRQAEAVLLRRTDRVVLVSEKGDSTTQLGVLRTADSLGVQQVHMVDDIHRKPLSSANRQRHVQDKQDARNLAQWLDYSEHDTLPQCLSELKARGYVIWATDCCTQATSGTALPLNPGVRIPSRVALLMGSLGKNKIVNSYVDKRVFVPTHGFSDGLPLPVQCALVLNTIFGICPEACGDLSCERMQHLRDRWYSQLKANQRVPISLESEMEFSSWKSNTKWRLSFEGEDDEFHDAEEYFDGDGERQTESKQQPASLVQWSSGFPSLIEASPASSSDSRRDSLGHTRRASFSEPTQSESTTVFDLLSPFTSLFSPFSPIFFSPAPPKKSEPVKSTTTARIHPKEKKRRASLSKRHHDSSEEEASCDDDDDDEDNDDDSEASSLNIEEPTMIGPASEDEASTEGWGRNTRGGFSQPNANTFLVRSGTYMSNSLKEPSGPPICSLLTANIFTSPKKIDRINELLPPPQRPPGMKDPPFGLPRFLCVNLQFPVYNPSFFSNEKDGQGFSIVWHFAVNYERANPGSMGLLRRFMENGTEKNGDATRDRLKLIMRLVNLEEAARTGGTRPTENHMIDRWNGKPVMVRPQHRYWRNGDLLEVDIDVHLWKYIIRKMLLDAPNRFHLVVWDLALVLQGNHPDELPEQVLCCGRCHYIDLAQVRPIPTRQIDKWKK